MQTWKHIKWPRKLLLRFNSLEITRSRDHSLFNIHWKSALQLAQPHRSPEGLNLQVHKLHSDIYKKESKDSHQKLTKFWKHWKFRAPGWFFPANGFYSSLREICWSQVFCLPCPHWAFPEEIYWCSSIANSLSNRYLLRKLLIFFPKCCPPHVAMWHAILTFTCCQGHQLE